MGKPIKNTLLKIAAVAGLLLLVPLIAMQFTDEVNWGPLDFALAGILLFGAGAVFMLISRKMDNRQYKIAAALTVGTALLLIWVNLAVGLIGSEDNPANLLYTAVLMTLFFGSFIVRLRPAGMAKVLFLTALVQITAGAVALLAGLGGTLIPDLFFAFLWFSSARLFLRSRPQKV